MRIPDDNVKCVNCGTIYPLNIMMSREGDVMCPPCTKYFDEIYEEPTNTDEDLLVALKILNRYLTDSVTYAFYNDSKKHSEPGYKSSIVREYDTIEAARAYLERALGEETRPDDQRHLDAEVPFYLYDQDIYHDWK